MQATINPTGAAPIVSPIVTILVVEDNPALNQAICEILKSYNHTTHASSNGYEALVFLQKQKPDVILCDIMMPEMDGFALLRHARADVKLRNVPFIFLTARTSNDDQRRARQIGIEDYLTKPVDSETLIVAIDNALRRRKNIEAEIQSELDLLRGRIVSLLQHEFRTPLTFVLGYADFLQDATKSNKIDLSELRQSSAAILAGGRRLEMLIETFLLYSELQNRTLKTEELETLHALETWRTISNEFADRLQEAHLRLTLLPQNATALVTCNYQMLHEALRRLLDNAVRYKRPASSIIWLSIETTPSHVGFCIGDEGVGISVEMLQRFTKPFEQVDRDNRTEPGAGLSLAMIRHIAHLHGGSLEIESEFGKGSTFILWLPLANEPQ